MIDTETWKIAGHDKMEKLIKYHMHIEHHNKHLFEKEKTSLSNCKAIHCFWEIQMDWQNGV